MIKEAGLEHLLMQTRAVEARRHGQADIVLERFVRGSGVDAVRIKALIQDQALEHGFPVDEEAVSVQLHLAHAEVAVHAVFSEGKGEVIQPSGSGLPQMKLL